MMLELYPNWAKQETSNFYLKKLFAIEYVTKNISLSE